MSARSFGLPASKPSSLKPAPSPAVPPGLTRRHGGEYPSRCRFARASPPRCHRASTRSCTTRWARTRSSWCRSDPTARGWCTRRSSPRDRGQSSSIDRSVLRPAHRAVGPLKQVVDADLLGHCRQVLAIEPASLDQHNRYDVAPLTLRGAAPEPIPVQLLAAPAAPKTSSAMRSPAAARHDGSYPPRARPKAHHHGSQGWIIAPAGAITRSSG